MEKINKRLSGKSTEAGIIPLDGVGCTMQGQNPWNGRQTMNDLCLNFELSTYYVMLNLSFSLLIFPIPTCKVEKNNTFLKELLGELNINICE